MVLLKLSLPAIPTQAICYVAAYAATLAQVPADMCIAEVAGALRMPMIAGGQR